MSVTGNAGKESVREDGMHGAADERQTASFEPSITTSSRQLLPE